MLDCTTYLWYEELICMSTSEEWLQKVKVSEEKTCSLWTQRAEESKAVRAYAAFHAVKVENVKIEEIAGTELGLKGLASLYQGSSLALAAPVAAHAGGNLQCECKLKSLLAN
jgi:uncharacterized membrane protein